MHWDLCIYDLTCCHLLLYSLGDTVSPKLASGDLNLLDDNHTSI
jgi:hypothetical protein